MQTEALESGGLKLFVGIGTVSRRGRTVRLGDVECRMLAMLMRANGAPVSAESLCAALWGAASPEAICRVRGVARRLRTKLRGVRIETIVREGYRLACEG